MASENDSNGKHGTEQVSILGRYIKPEDFKHLMDFYKADHKLNQKERQLLSEDFTTARNVSTLWGMFDCTIALLSPTLFRKYQEKRAGIVVPKGTRRPLFHRPILSSLFATGIYFCSLYFHSKNHQEYRIAQLTEQTQDSQVSEDERASKQRILNVWKSIQPAQLTLFSLYYYETASNPNLIMKDPREMASSDPHAVQYFPPPENSRQSTLAAVQEHERNAPHWEKLREANGFAAPKNNTSGEAEEAAGETSEISSNSESPGEPQGPASAWEKLRKKS